MRMLTASSMADELGQASAQLRRVRDFEEQRGDKLAVPGHQGVVRVELRLDAFGGGDALGAHHLLDLVEEGAALLEREGDDGAEGDAQPPAQGDHRGLSVGAPALVLGEGQDFVEGDLVHR